MRWREKYDNESQLNVKLTWEIKHLKREISFNISEIEKLNSKIEENESMIKKLEEEGLEKDRVIDSHK